MRKLIVLFSILFCSCIMNAQTKPNTNKKDSAAIQQPIQQPTPVFYLLGKLEDFQLLFRAVTTPKDVTPNQQEALAAWIQKLQQVPVDSTKKK